MSGSSGWSPIPRKTIDAWVAAHRHELPKTLTEISRLPIPFRRAVLAALTPEVRLALWCEQLESHVGETSMLTPQQQAFIRQSITELPSLFAEAPGPSPLIEWEGRMKLLFSRDEAGPIFGMLGPPEPPGGLPIPS
jgi:hypothetical protein